MSCQNHPNKESVSNCQFCGKELCEECTISIANKNYCEECMSELVGPELASIASKSPNSETQNNSIIKETTPQEQTQIPPEKTDPAVRKPERLKQEIPSQNQNIANNINNAPYSDHDDIYSDNRLYNDIHGDKSPSNPQSNNEVEEKYEKYLDDLYYDEAAKKQTNTGYNENIEIREDGKISLSEQLAQDEAEHGPITKEPFIPDVPEELPESNEFEDTRINKNANIDNTKNIPIMENLRNVSSNSQNIEKEGEYTHTSLHRGSIHYKKDEKKPFNSAEKILTVILIILIILVAMYVIYLLTLHDQYPSFINAITAFFGNPGEVFSQMFS